MWAGVAFIVVAAALMLVAALMSGAIRRPRLRSKDRAPAPPIVGWGSDSRLPRL